MRHFFCEALIFLRLSSCPPRAFHASFKRMLNSKTKWIVLASLLASTVLPFATQAATRKLDLYNPRKHYKDEKINPMNAASRCTTAVFQKMHTNAETQAQQEFTKLKNSGKESELNLTNAFKTYEQELSLAWGAMQEPYCGFGAFGATAAQKSYKKTLDRAHVNFLAHAKSGALATDLILVPVSHTTGTAVAPAVVSRTVVETSSSSSSRSISPTVAPTSENSAPESTDSAVRISRSLVRGEKSTNVQRLQNVLVKKGLLDKEYATGYFGNYTEKAIISFQLGKGLIKSRASYGAGFVGRKTLTAMGL